MNKDDVLEFRIKNKIRQLKETYDIYYTYLLKDSNDMVAQDIVYELRKQISLLEDILKGI